MQTKAGGIKMRQTMLKKHGSEEAWKAEMGRIGSEGGKNGHTGGFYYAKWIRGDIDFIRKCGAKGGKVSRRGKVVHESDDLWPEVFNLPPKKSLWQKIIRSK